MGADRYSIRVNYYSWKFDPKLDLSKLQRLKMIGCASDLLLDNSDLKLLAQSACGLREISILDLLSVTIRSKRLILNCKLA